MAEWVDASVYAVVDALYDGRVVQAFDRAGTWRNVVLDPNGYMVWSDGEEMKINFLRQWRIADA